MKTRFKTTVRSLLVLVLALTQLWLPSGAGAQVLPPQNPTQFDVTGFIQAATLDAACATDPLCGGTITVNHQVITVPKNTILQMPAAALTWQQVFAQAPFPYGLNTGPVPSAGAAQAQTGLALRDVPAPLGTYEAHVVGNRVKDAAGNDRYIAGLLFLAQHSLQSGQGFINFIDYATGEIYVGGTTLDNTTGARVKVNDPLGRFGRAWTPDQRFTIDEDNPTVRSESAYPMCTPRFAPPTPDSDCPQTNRPPDPASPSGFAMIFTMPAIANVTAGSPDPRKMAPFEIGDYVSYSGILVTDDATQPTVAPAPPAAGAAPLGTYIAAFQVIGNVGLFTAPGDSLAYVATDVFILGVGGNTVAGAAEATVRTRFEGFTTDPTRNILLYGLDVDACTGNETPRPWGAIGVDPGPPNGAVMGRWRFRPPCTGVSPTDKACTPPPAGTFLPPTREMRAAIETATGSGVAAQSVLDANGTPLPGSNQYTGPIFEFLFPENAGVGTPIVPNNFESMPFLTLGSGLLEGTTSVVGQLDPWPLGFAAPPAPPVCAVTGNPTANPGANQTVASGSLVTLTGTGTDPNGLPLTFVWTQTSGTPVALTQASNTANPNSVTFVAPVVPFGLPQAVLTFQLVVTNGNGVASVPATVSIAVNPVATDVVAISLVEYRIAKQRLTVDATSTAPLGTARLTMQAFDRNGNPQGAPQNMPFIGGGIYEVILVGAPQPTTVRVTSNFGGSATSGITRLRQ